MSTSDESFFGRWSKRKQDVLREENAGKPDVLVDPPDADTPDLDGLSDAEILTKLELPDPEKMVMGDDFKVFMGKSVPVHLRQRALKTLWRSNPTLANLDGLVDYDDDYTGTTSATGVLKTAYKVGRGFLDDINEREAAARALVQETESEDVAVVADETHPETQPEAQTPTINTAPPEQASEKPAPRPRMKFDVS